MSDVKYENLVLRRTGDYDTYAVVYCSKNATEVRIPSQIDGIAVTEIADNAFEECGMLLSVEFEEPTEEVLMSGNYFSKIGEYAFSYCTNLVSIDIPSSVCSIGRGAFFQCESLKIASFSSDAYVGSYAFSECEALEKVPLMTCISEGVFNGCEKLAAVKLGEGLFEIEESAFEDCAQLTEITIPKSVKRIDQLAFRGCYNLEKVKFEDINGWFVRIRYNGSTHALDTSDEKDVARELSMMDFDDGVDCWFKN